MHAAVTQDNKFCPGHLKCRVIINSWDWGQGDLNSGCFRLKHEEGLVELQNPWILFFNSKYFLVHFLFLKYSNFNISICIPYITCFIGFPFHIPCKHFWICHLFSGNLFFYFLVSGSNWYIWRVGSFLQTYVFWIQNFSLPCFLWCLSNLFYSILSDFQLWSKFCNWNCIRTIWREEVAGEAPIGEWSSGRGNEGNSCSINKESSDPWAVETTARAWKI